MNSGGAQFRDTRGQALLNLTFSLSLWLLGQEEFFHMYGEPLCLNRHADLRS